MSASNARTVICVLGRLTCVVLLLVSVMLLPWRLALADDPTPQPSPEALAAAKELIGAMHLTDQYKVIVGDIIQTLKPSIVQGRPEVDRQYDAIAPTLVDAFQPRLSELSDIMAVIYARNLSIEDLQALVAFYSTPTGQRLLEKLPTLAGESRVAISRTVVGEVRQRMIEELRKKGIGL